MVIAEDSIVVPYAGFVSKIIDLANPRVLGLVAGKDVDTGGDTVVSCSRLWSGYGCTSSSRNDGPTVAVRDSNRKPFHRPAAKRHVFTRDAVDLENSVIS